MRALILSTPLRYPGGKSKAVKDLYEYMPQMSQYDEWREPFLGGGSMSIEITKKFPDMKIWVNDLYPALFNFWTMVKNERNLRNINVNFKKNSPAARFS